MLWNDLLFRRQKDPQRPRLILLPYHRALVLSEAEGIARYRPDIAPIYNALGQLRRAFHGSQIDPSIAPQCIRRNEYEQLPLHHQTISVGGNHRIGSQRMELPRLDGKDGFPLEDIPAPILHRDRNVHLLAQIESMLGLHRHHNRRIVPHHLHFGTLRRVFFPVHDDKQTCPIHTHPLIGHLENDRRVRGYPRGPRHRLETPVHHARSHVVRWLHRPHHIPQHALVPAGIHGRHAIEVRAFKRGSRVEKRRLLRPSEHRHHPVATRIGPIDPVVHGIRRRRSSPHDDQCATLVAHHIHRLNVLHLRRGHRVLRNLHEYGQHRKRSPIPMGVHPVQV